MDLKLVKIADIKIPEVRVTSRFTEEQWDQFRTAYKQTGALDPILVYNVEGTMWLSDGLHRLVQERENGSSEVWAIVLPGDLADVFTKNIMLDHLRGKHPPSEMVKVVKLLWTELGLDSEAIAEKTGLSRDYIEKLQVIGELSPWALEQLDQDKIGVGLAFALTRLKDVVQQETVLGQALLYRWTIKDVEAFIKEILELSEPPEPAAPDQEPAAPPTIQCFYCRQPYPLGHCANPNTCVACSGIMLATVAEAERQFKAEQTVKAE